MPIIRPCAVLCVPSVKWCRALVGAEVRSSKARMQQCFSRRKVTGGQICPMGVTDSPEPYRHPWQHPAQNTASKQTCPSLPAALLPPSLQHRPLCLHYLITTLPLLATAVRLMYARPHFKILVEIADESAFCSLTRHSSTTGMTTIGPNLPQHPHPHLVE
jgi:hypothetical protein